MTVSSTINKSGPYNGNGVTTAFEYEFRILDETHLTVVKTVGGVETVLSLADYAVSGVGAQVGGSVILNTPPATGETITIVPNPPFTQQVDLENQGAYYAETVERALDLAAMRDQMLAEGLSRAVQIPVSADAAELDALIADIVRLGDSADAIDTVAGIAGDVSSVAANSVNINAVAGIEAEIIAVPALVQAAEDARDKAIAAVPPPTFATLAAANGSVVPDVASRVGILRYHSTSAFDPLVYHEQAGEPSHDLKFQAADGRWFAPAVASVTIDQAGGVADNGVTNNSPAFGRARDYLKAGIAAGTILAGILGIGNGVYACENTSGSAALRLDAVENIILQGQSRRGSVLKLGDSQAVGTHLLSFAMATGCEVRSLTLDGNRNNQAVTSHGMRGSDVYGLTIDDVHCKNCYTYGLGFEAGDIENLSIHNVEISDVGFDGLDIKNKGTGNSGLRISRLVVRRFGLFADPSSAGVDVRGPADLSDIVVEGIGAGPGGQVGIRFRFGETGISNGLGAHKSTLVGFRCIAVAKTTPVVGGIGGQPTRGLDIGSYDCTINGGMVFGCGEGVLAFQSNTTVSGVTVVTADKGFRTDDVFNGTSIATHGQNISFQGCTAKGCAVAGFDINTDGCVIQGCNLQSNLLGINKLTTAVNLKIIGNQFTGNTTNVALPGSAVKAYGNGGWKTSGSFTGNVSTATTGQKLVTIAHNLNHAPDVTQVLAMIQTPGTNAVKFTSLKVNSANSTEIVIGFDVTTASAGTTADIHITVDCFP